MKKKRMGRPPLPPGQSKDAQVAIRLNEDEAEELVEAASRNGLSQAEEARDRIVGNPPHVWVTCKWTREEMNGKKIRLCASLDGTLWDVKGELFVREKLDGRKCITVQSGQAQGYGAWKFVVFRLPQDYVDRMEKSESSEVDFVIPLRA
jgi:hypothetical protein